VLNLMTFRTPEEAFERPNNIWMLGLSITR
jgi:hypothetical protein